MAIPVVPSVRHFSLIWAGELLSMLGSGLSSFAIGVWVFQGTQSATRYAFVSLCATLPAVVISPLAGTLVDRLPRGRVMVGANILSAVVTGVAMMLLGMGRLTLPAIAVLTIIGSALGTTQGLAFTASTRMLVPAAQLGRASGMTQVAMAISGISAPVLAGALIKPLGLAGILAIDLATFLVIALVVALAGVPQPSGSGVKQDAGRQNLRSDLLFGIRHIWRSPGLRTLLLYFAAMNFASSMAIVTLSPLLLTKATPAVLGSVMSAGAVGMLAGSIVSATWQGPRQRVRWVLASGMVSAAAIAVAGLAAFPVAIGACACIAMLCVPLVNATSQAIWLSSVSPEVQGRVFSVRTALALSASPIAYALAGPLLDGLLEPQMREGMPLASVLGPVFGTSPGSGMAMLLSCAGLLGIGAVLVASRSKGLRTLDRMTVEEGPAEAGMQGETP